MIIIYILLAVAGIAAHRYLKKNNGEDWMLTAASAMATAGVLLAILRIAPLAIEVTSQLIAVAIVAAIAYIAIRYLNEKKSQSDKQQQGENNAKKSEEVEGR